jgi:glycyl-tRNA synthetase alpha chain
MKSFQKIILELQNFWADNGCAILQPIDLEVGAGTLHPATVLRTLGKKPWKVVYVQPCRRPTDIRYAKNPNRLGHYFQLQVLLKPAPKNIKYLYLKSLDLIGLDTKKNDIRFVEDDWENPSVGASGRGFEVWFNGMEITQFTYMQQVGGIECEVISGEITYGLERIAMNLQEIDNIFSIKWNCTNDNNQIITYGDLFKKSEIENSYFILEHSDIDILFKNFYECKTQSQFLAEKKLAIPAYEQALKASNILNLLDARNAISVNERASYINQIRQLVKNCCELSLNIDN